MFDSSNERLICEKLFAEPGREFFLRELAEETDVSPSTASRIVDKLEKRGIADVNREGVRMSIKSSGSQTFKDLKRSHNLWKLSESGIIDEIEENCFPEAIVLFGSYSRGEDRSGSDIDLAVVNGREFNPDTSKFELSREVNVHNIDSEESGENFMETLANGITMRGRLEI